MEKIGIDIIIVYVMAGTKLAPLPPKGIRILRSSLKMVIICSPSFSANFN